MDLKKINSKEEYEQVLERIYELMDATPGSPEEPEYVKMAERRINQAAAQGMLPL